MALVQIASLVGKKVDGVKADLRSRNADGSLRHEHQTEKPCFGVLRKVEIRKKKDGPWLYWTFDGHEFCNYSGVAILADGRHLEYYLEVTNA